MCYQYLCCLLEPLCLRCMVNKVACAFDFKLSHYCRKKMTLESMYQELVTYIKYLHAFVNLNSPDNFPKIAQRPWQRGSSPEDGIDNPQTLPEEVEVSCMKGMFKNKALPRDSIVCRYKFSIPMVLITLAIVPGDSQAHPRVSLGQISVCHQSLLDLTFLHVS